MVSAPNVRMLPRVCVLGLGVSTQMRACYLVFVYLGWVYVYKCAHSFSCLCTWVGCMYTNARMSSAHAFGGFWVVWSSKRAQLFSRLERISVVSAPNVRDDLLERCDLARESNSERRACSGLKARCAFNASEVCLRQ